MASDLYTVGEGPLTSAPSVMIHRIQWEYRGGSGGADCVKAKESVV